MSEWQPARLNPNAHPKELVDYGDEPLETDKLEITKRIIVRVREVPIDQLASYIKKCGCKRFFEIHPRDLEIVGYVNTTAQRIACEAEILTD